MHFQNIKHTFPLGCIGMVPDGNTMFAIFTYYGIYKALQGALQNTFYVQKNKNKKMMVISWYFMKGTDEKCLIFGC